MTDKFGESIGIMHITTGGADLDLHPKMQDNRAFRRIMLDKENKENKAQMFEKFEDFMIELIKRDYPQDNTERIAEYVNLNCMALFEEVLVAFRWTTREELEKSKKESTQEIKKLIEAS